TLQRSSPMLQPPPRSPRFPTRRSSDLHERRREGGRSRPAQYAGGVPQVVHQSRRVARVAARQTTRSRAQGRARRRESAARAVARSEEDTSELQSPDHLVCRLLLEKKK